MGHLLAVAIAALLIQSASPSQTLSQKREALQPEVFVTTMTPEELARAASTGLEHDTEVARSESITIVVTIAACEAGERGACNASADVVAYKPDGSIHTEVKNLGLNSRRATAPLPMTANDATGLYKVVATVRDLNARRFGKAERSFGVK